MLIMYPNAHLSILIISRKYPNDHNAVKPPSCYFLIA